MDFQVLISTMNNKFHSRKLSLSFPYLVINQITENDLPASCDTHTINTTSKGLSISRNLALQYASSHICLLSDDDLTYLPNLGNKVIEAFNSYPDADIITFKIINADGSDYKDYSKVPFYHNHRTIMKVSSVEIGFRRNIVDDGIFFDENFGLGAKWPTGEENIFLSDALKNGKKILYCPIEIVCHPQLSSGFDYNNKRLAYAKGAMLHRIFSWKGYILCIFFAVKHYKRTPYSFTRFLGKLLYGCYSHHKSCN